MSFLGQAYPRSTSSDTTGASSGTVEDTTRKRTRDVVDARDIDLRPLTIKHHSADPFAKPQTLIPLSLLSRSRLPLAYLDPPQDGSRLFTAHVHSLEACAEHHSEDAVLIAEDAREGRLYAIERWERRKYALCRLARWVMKADVVQARKTAERVEQSPSKRRAIQPLRDGQPWWTMATAAVNPDATSTVDRRAPRLSMLAKSQNTSAVEVIPEPLNRPDQPKPDGREISADAVSKAQSSQVVLEELTKHYLDYLYLSRVPLTYFVKGPMARVRAAFSAPSPELVEFLRGTILSSSVMDRKFREDIAELVKALPILETPETKPKSRKRRKWKPKRDKSGFFADEKDYAEQWWRKDDDAEHVHSVETVDATIRRRIQRLRDRETFLQVILILELLALESAMPQDAGVAPNLAETKDLALAAGASGEQCTVGEKKARKKKLIDVAAVLETLLDRLCIWHSLESSSPSSPSTGADGMTDGDAKDDLKVFAAEVVVPYYGARIPDHAYSTSRKLGGPSAPGPANKPCVAGRKPGEPAVRSVPEKRHRKALARVSTDTLNRSGKTAPILQRSATDSDALAPLIKREMSQTPSLESIPMSKERGFRAQHAVQWKRASRSGQGSFGRREVDLSAISQANEAKMRKKAEMDQKLREVIDTIKKPNRDRAVEENARTADESFARTLLKKGKAYAAVQKSRQTTARMAVAVTATPRRVQATPARYGRADHSSAHQLYSEVTSVVPSSSSRLLPQHGELPSSSFAILQTGHRSRHGNGVEDTPSRGFNRFMPCGLAREPGTLLESPTANRTPALGSTPAKAIVMPCLQETPGARPTLRQSMYTPQANNMCASPEEQSQRDDSGGAWDTAGASTRSIYDALGWDQDDYEELV